MSCGEVTVSLLDPWSHKRIETPCRGKMCSHVLVFDLQTFLECRQDKCHVCDKLCTVDDLIVDEDIERILKDAPSNVDKVMMAPDGSWRLREIPTAATNKRQRTIIVETGTLQQPIDLECFG